MKFKRWIAILMAVVMMVSVVSPTAFAEGWGQNSSPTVVNGDAGDGGMGESSDCTCTTPYTEESSNQNCPVCQQNISDCKAGQSQPAEDLVLEVGWEPEQRYAAYNGEPVAITVSGSLRGTEAESVTVAITLSDAEAALLTIPESSGLTLTDSDATDGKKMLSFTVSAGEPFSKTLKASATATTDATQPTTLDVASTDVTATATPEAEGGTGQTVQITFNEGATAASILTFVEKLPDADNPYGSVTESEGSVDELTVTYVDKDGQPIARQEKAPTFTLWYQVDGAGAVEADEEKPPFGLEKLPEIKQTPDTSTWTGSVAKDTPLPSKVLALEGNTVVEKNDQLVPQAILSRGLLSKRRSFGADY